ncbi:HPP family protein [Streptomyces sp. NBC_01214]|uniref:HPP family protein n=1 Tax=Streptomyces sp. NBC_01214 TaxID=2903777 RepID=UPI00224DB079|nr:HPP family protein [Streptomyces sp. NBC_01214]MCX4803858.1 HPP family protein [Streptomyces sp. NBC_01214]
MNADSALPDLRAPGPGAPREDVPRPEPGGRRSSAWPGAAAALHGVGAVTAALLVLAAIGAVISEPVLVPSLAASAGVLHSTPTLPVAQPRSVVVAHLLGAGAGYVVLALAQSNPWSAALAGGLTFAATTLARTPHSPACATAVVVVLQTPAPARFVPLLLGSAVVLVLAGFAASRVRRGAARYPVRWW